ncbi:hypothetical protein QR680_000589 [Steinernema hermaphroditum]|uniref:Uncharacterized protein n=1 Tax=Steinernema hermaphroditum TaxID=289476 RepID=A0AA39LEF6_9BILA|nr:hypothetical protein QR680_000589 [Steinernema hermaphroditum]
MVRAMSHPHQATNSSSSANHFHHFSTTHTPASLLCALYIDVLPLKRRYSVFLSSGAPIRGCNPCPRHHELIGTGWPPKRLPYPDEFGIFLRFMCNKT